MRIVNGATLAQLMPYSLKILDKKAAKPLSGSHYHSLMRATGDTLNMKNRHHIFLLIALMLTIFAGPASAEEIKAAYLYNLSDFNGVIPYNWVSICSDEKKGETYVADPSERLVRVFNDKGMEVFSFGDDGSFDNISAVAVTENDEVFILSRINSNYSIIRCNFRGEPLGKVELKNVPPEFSKDFVADSMVYRGGLLYLSNRGTMKVVVVDTNGVFKDGYDLAALLEIDEKKRRDADIVGFNVNHGGDLLFTIPVYFSAYVVSPDHKVRSFGVRGSSPGKFNIVGGIAADKMDNIYVTDILRCVVMIFDKNFNFKTEFGYRGLDPGNLIAPMDLAVNNGMLYVTQSRARGVSVFRITAD